MVVTILTPTYNRGSILPKLYESLKTQTAKDFEWLVVDDGSTDNTKELVQQWAAESDFPIRYLYKDNGGKHTALNAGIATITTDLTFIVDSDDIVTPDAVETITRYHKRYARENNLCGYVFLRMFPDGTINGKPFSPDEMVADYIESRINAHDTLADKAEVFFTRCLKEFPFPQYGQEKFLGEDIVWIRMAQKYRMVHINKAIYVGDYLTSGLTQNRRRHNIQSPIGCMHRAEEFLSPRIRIIYRIKGALQYIIYGRFAGYTISQLLKNTSYRILVACAVIPGLLLYTKWRWEYQKNT